MARGTSRNGKILIDQSAAANAAASEIKFVGDWSVNQPEPPTDDVTALSDTQSQAVAGLVGFAKIAINGFINLGSDAFHTVMDSQLRTTYIYPDFVGAPTFYWCGTPAYGGDIVGAVQNAVKGALTGTAIGSSKWYP